MTGRIHSIQTMGTLDGPGVRFVAFLQGCHLRCACCHNPDTWDRAGGEPIEAAELVARATRYTTYFGKEGGITLSGGEPLLQPGFVQEVFALAHAAGIHTCLDTAGVALTDAVQAALHVADRVLLDIKYTADALYRSHVGCGMETPLAFLAYLNEKGVPTTLRQVIIPGLHDTEENIAALKRLKESHRCVDTVELLPFRKLCTVKYDSLGIPFPLAAVPEPGADTMRRLTAQLQ